MYWSVVTYDWRRAGEFSAPHHVSIDKARKLAADCRPYYIDWKKRTFGPVTIH